MGARGNAATSERPDSRYGRVMRTLTEFPPLCWSGGYLLPAGAGVAIGGLAGSVWRLCQAVSYSFGLR